MTAVERMPDRLRVVSIDPGLDDVAVAFWNTPPGNINWRLADFTTKAKCLDPIVQHVKTRSSMPLQLRLWTVMSEVQEMLGMLGPHLVIIEIPSIAGLYRSRQDQGGAVVGKTAEVQWLFNLACGATIAGAVEAGYPVELWKPRKNKADRQAMVRRVLLSEKMDRRYTGDELDAIGVGMFADWNFDPPQYDRPTLRRHL